MWCVGVGETGGQQAAARRAEHAIALSAAVSCCKTQTTAGVLLFPHCLSAANCTLPQAKSCAGVCCLRHAPLHAADTLSCAAACAPPPLQLAVLPSTMATLDAYTDNPGTWLFHCHLNDHIHGGMMMLFNVAGEQPTHTLNGQVRCANAGGVCGGGRWCLVQHCRLAC